MGKVIKIIGGLFVVFVILVAIAVVNEDPPPDAATEANNTNISSKVPSSIKVVIPPHKIILDESTKNIKRSVEVSLDKRISEQELEALGRHIKQQEKHAYERTFIGYRVAGQASSMYWATTHYDPDLKVSILGETKEQHAELVAANTGPEQFATVADMVEAFGDYSAESKTFAVDADNKYRFSPFLLDDDHPDVIYHMTLRAIAINVYNAYLHTSVDVLTIESVPLIGDNLFNRSNAKFAMDKKVSVVTSRKDALTAIQKFIKISELSELKKPTKYGYMYLKEFDELVDGSSRINDLEALIHAL